MSKNIHPDNINSAIVTMQERVAKNPSIINLRLFETDITDISKEIKELNKGSINGVIENIETRLDNLLNQQSNTIPYKAFVNYFVLFTYYRRNRLIIAIKELFSRYSNNFQSIKFHTHIELLYKALNPFKIEARFELLEKANELAMDNEFKNHTGILHHYVELCSEYFEFILHKLDDAHQQKDSQELFHCKNAYKVAKTIIEIDNNYAKFYATFGRIAALNKEFEEAFEAFSNAIALEDVDTAISTYGLYKMHALTVKNNYESSEFIEDKLNQHVKTFDDKLSKLKGENIRTLGLFAGLITFILGSTTITLSESENTIRVMALFTAVFLIYFSLVTFYGSIDTILQNNEKLMKINSSYIVLGMILGTFVAGITLIILLLSGVL